MPVTYLTDIVVLAPSPETAVFMQALTHHVSRQ